MILSELYLLLAILFLAGKDGTSYKLKDKTLVASDGSLTKKRIDRWHRDGVILNLLFVLPFIAFDFINWWKYLTYALLIRLAFYDPAFNKFAGLPMGYLGETAGSDNIFKKVFKKNGAVIKGLIFLGLLIGLNILFKENLVNSQFFRIL